jgi:indole-3-glycerol phosphate synthase
MILDDIVASKRKELAAAKRCVSLQDLKQMASSQPPALDFAASLKVRRPRVIAEVKKASPSAGIIRADFNPVEIALIYADNGAAAISVLTESAFFQGSLDYLRDIRQAVGSRLPLLRKDFIFDPYQVYEARAYGADSILLITAIVTPEKLKSLITLSRELGMEPLVEVHNATEIAVALKAGGQIIGINNRDLNTFKTDLVTTTILRPHIPGDKIVVSESGIKDRYDVASLRNQGVSAVLIGESLMSSPDIAAAIKDILS